MQHTHTPTHFWEMCVGIVKRALEDAQAEDGAAGS